MIPNAASRWIYATTFVLAAAGFLIPLWPVAIIGVAVATLSGRFVFGVCLALLLDIAWGAPTGTAAYFYFPVTIFALVGTLAHLWGKRFVIDSNPRETL